MIGSWSAAARVGVPAFVELHATGPAVALVVLLEDGASVSTIVSSAGFIGLDVVAQLVPRQAGAFRLWARAVDASGACAQTGAVRVVTVAP